MAPSPSLPSPTILLAPFSATYSGTLAATHFQSASLLLIMRNKPQGRIGGGEGVEGLYGSVSRTGMARVLAALTMHCGLDAASCLVDVGAGLGRCGRLRTSACIAAVRDQVS